jgi:hypothetical protein
VLRIVDRFLLLFVVSPIRLLLAAVGLTPSTVILAIGIDPVLVLDKLIAGIRFLLLIFISFIELELLQVNILHTLLRQISQSIKLCCGFT